MVDIDWFRNAAVLGAMTVVLVAAGRIWVAQISTQLLQDLKNSHVSWPSPIFTASEAQAGVVVAVRIHRAQYCTTIV